MEWSRLSIGEIKEKASGTDIEGKKGIISALQADPRKGVKNLIKALQREIDDYEKESDRIIKMKEFEYRYMGKGAKYIAGIDEVGRGPLAGPVYASAVVFPIDCIIRGIDDSKKLTPAKRLRLYEDIKNNALCYATGRCDEGVIDRINILNATHEAMKEAVAKLKVKPQVLLVDGLKIPGIEIFQVPIVKGDSLSFSIAAASIIAKVERDSVMEDYHKKYPVYNFMSNKGYGTGEHIEALKKYGPCPIHRESFIKGIL